MKKIFTILSIALLSMTFTGCEKEVQEIQDTSHITITIFRCPSVNQIILKYIILPLTCHIYHHHTLAMIVEREEIYIQIKNKKPMSKIKITDDFR